METIEADKLEQVQRHAARWATGSWGVVSVTALLGELGWEDLAGRRGNQRLTLFYKILDGDTRYFDLTSDTLDLHIHSTRSRKNHSKNLKKLSGKDRNSPLWKGTITRTIAEWNRLPQDTVAAPSLETFKARLRPPRPAPPAPGP